MRKPQYQPLFSVPPDHEILTTRFDGETYVVFYIDKGVCPNVVTAVKGNIRWEEKEE